MLRAKKRIWNKSTGRDYSREAAYDASPARKKARAQRNKARSLLAKKGLVRVGDGKDVGHKKAISKGGKNSASNLMVQNASANRSFKRKSDGSMASETSKKEHKRGRK